jgi:hypothetical protein
VFSSLLVLDAARNVDDDPPSVDDCVENDVVVVVRGDGDGDGICHCVETGIAKNGRVVDDGCRTRFDPRYPLLLLLRRVVVVCCGGGGVVAVGGGSDDEKTKFPRPIKTG